MTAEPGMPHQPLHETPNDRLNTDLLHQLTASALRPDARFGRDVSLTLEERGELMAVATRANDILAPRYEDPAWKQFTQIIGGEGNDLRSFDNHESPFTRVPAWCRDGGHDAPIHEVGYRDAEGTELRGLSVPSKVFYLVDWTNAVNALRSYATDADNIPQGWPAEEMGLAVRDLTRLIELQSQRPPAEEARAMTAAPAPAADRIGKEAINGTLDLSAEPEPVEDVTQPIRGKLIDEISGQEQGQVHEQEQQAEIPLEPTNLLRLDPAQLKRLAVDAHHNGMDSPRLHDIYDSTIRANNVLLTELLFRISERVDQAWGDPAAASLSRGFTLGYHLIDTASKNGAPTFGWFELPKAAPYYKGVDLEDLKDSADALLQSQIDLNEAFNQAALGLPEGTDAFMARMGAGLAVLAEMIAADSADNDSL